MEIGPYESSVKKYFHIDVILTRRVAELEEPLAKPVDFWEGTLRIEDCLSAASSADTKATDQKSTRLETRVRPTPQRAVV